MADHMSRPTMAAALASAEELCARLGQGWEPRAWEMSPFDGTSFGWRAERPFPEGDGRSTVEPHGDGFAAKLSCRGKVVAAAVSDDPCIALQLMVEPRHAREADACEPLAIQGIVRARAIAEPGGIYVALLPGPWPLPDFRELCRWGAALSAAHHPSRLKPPGRTPTCSSTGCEAPGKVGQTGQGGALTWLCADHAAALRAASLLGGGAPE